MSRFLFVAAVGSPKSLMTDGSTILLMSVVRELCEKGHFCYVLFPEGCDLHTLPQIDRSMYLISGFPVQVLDGQMWCVDQSYIYSLCSVAYGKYVVDAAVVLHGAQVPPLMQAMGKVDSGVTIPIFCLEQGTNWITTMPGYNLGDTAEQWGVYGASLAESLVVMSEFDRQNWEDKARAYDLSPTRLSHLITHMSVASAPIPLEKLTALVQSIAQGEPRYELPTCLWAARTNAAKNPAIVLDIFDTLYRSGEPMQVKYLSQTSELKGDVVSDHLGLFNEREYITPQFGAKQDDLYREASKSHAFVCWSHSESYNATVVEVTLLGCVFLCRDSSNLRKLYPQGLGGEEFWLSSKDDAVKKLRWVLQNYEQAYAMQAEFRASLMRQQTEQRISSLLEKKVQEYYARQTGPSVYGISEGSGLGILTTEVVYGLPDQFSMEDLLVGIKEVASNFKLSNMVRYATRKVPTNWALHRFIQRSGAVVDTSERRFPTYKKVKT